MPTVPIEQPKRPIKVEPLDTFIFYGSILKYEYIGNAIQNMQPDQMLTIDFENRKEADRALTALRGELYKPFIPAGYRLATRMLATIDESTGIHVVRAYIALAIADSYEEEGND